MNAARPCIAIEIVRAEHVDNPTINLQLPSGATVADALRAAAAASGFDDIPSMHDQVGIFGVRCELSHVLQDGDRVELYRPLLLDSKAARRLRAKRATEAKCAG